MKEQQTARRRKLRLDEPRLFGYVEQLYRASDWELIDSADENGALPERRYTEQTLRQAFHRGIIDRDETVPSGWRVASYHTRLSCMMEGDQLPEWYALPEEVWKGICDYMMDPEVWLPSREAETCPENPSNEWVLPLEQARAVIERVPEDAWFSLHQCNCSAYTRSCAGKDHICIGWRTALPAPNSKQARGLVGIATKAEALRALEEADRRGLVHCVSPHGICNCCTCCCINLHNYRQHRVRDHLLNLGYAARVKENVCRGCGACTRRCPFGAIRLTQGRAAVAADLCWGCGVCRTGCPVSAIEMVELRRAAVLE